MTDIIFTFIPLLLNIMASIVTSEISHILHPSIEAKKACLNENFGKCVKGYHYINDEPIKESPWEDINTQILIESEGCTIDSTSSGSHVSGSDIRCSIGEFSGGFSNKSTQYGHDKRDFKISSYRLTTVCTDKEPGMIDDILDEINRRKNFKYYSIIVRKTEDTNVIYDWYLIPADYPPFNPRTYSWEHKIGKTGKNKGLVTGWKTNVVDGSSMSITFNMSSQLWLNIHITEDMKQFIMGSVTVKLGRTLNYINIYDTLMTE